MVCVLCVAFRVFIYFCKKKGGGVFSVLCPKERGLFLSLSLSLSLFVSLFFFFFLSSSFFF